VRGVFPRGGTSSRRLRGLRASRSWVEGRKGAGVAAAPEESRMDVTSRPHEVGCANPPNGATPRACCTDADRPFHSPTGRGSSSSWESTQFGAQPGGPFHETSWAGTMGRNREQRAGADRPKHLRSGYVLMPRCRVSGALPSRTPMVNVAPPDQEALLLRFPRPGMSPARRRSADCGLHYGSDSWSFWLAHANQLDAFESWDDGGSIRAGGVL
jgi:hypothetical protein